MSVVIQLACASCVTMNISAVLTIITIAICLSEATFFRHKGHKHQKGPLSYLSDIGEVFDGLIRYAPDFYDVIPKVAHKLLGTDKHHHQHHHKHHSSDYDDEDDYYHGHQHKKHHKSRPTHHAVPHYPSPYHYGGAPYHYGGSPYHYGGSLLNSGHNFDFDHGLYSNPYEFNDFSYHGAQPFNDFHGFNHIDLF